MAAMYENTLGKRMSAIEKFDNYFTCYSNRVKFLLCIRYSKNHEWAIETNYHLP